MDKQFVNTSLAAVQPHVDEIKAHVAGGGEDAEHVARHLDAVQAAVSAVQDHVAPKEPAKVEAPKVATEAKAEPPKVEAPKITGLGPVVRPAVPQSSGWPIWATLLIVAGVGFAVAVAQGWIRL